MEYLKLSLSVLIVCQLTNGVLNPPLKLQTVKEWNVIRYKFDYDSPVNDQKFYNPMGVLITGIAVGRNRIYVSTPQLFSGVSSTISSASLSEFGDSPALEPFPDWSFTTTNGKPFNCSDLKLISVYRMKIDSCNRLWALDAGVSRSLEDYEITCPPKILVFDLDTNQVVRRIDFPPEVLRGESLFTNLIIDETTSQPGGTCDDVFVYISDTVEPAIVVYDSQRDITWRLVHPAMYPDPDFAESEILGYKFVLMDGIVGVSFDPKAGIVYFQPLATDRIFSITTQVLRAGPIAINEVLPVKMVGKKSSQGISLVTSPYDGSLIFSPLTETAIASWNPSTNQQSILAYDQDRLQFVADMSFTPNDPGALYVVSSKFHRFFLKNLNVNEINNRIQRIQLPITSQNYFHGFLNHPQFQEAHVLSNYHHNSLERNPNVYQSNKYFTSIRKPYFYEPVGLKNRGLSNPFTALNYGEALPKRANILAPRTSSLLDRLNPSATSFSSIRVAKSIRQNATAIY